MIKVQYSLPKNLTVAISGGVDSVSIAHFLAKKHNVKLIFVHHQTVDSEMGLSKIKKLNLPLSIYHINDAKPKNKSWEEFWRDERYSVFHSIDSPIVTGHHLNDCVETWIWSSMHGKGQIIPYRNQNVIRPFRLTDKKYFYHYADKNNLEYHEDQSNQDNKFIRNYIRNEMMPHVLKVNPGIKKTIYKKILKEIEI